MARENIDIGQEGFVSQVLGKALAKTLGNKKRFSSGVVLNNIRHEVTEIMGMVKESEWPKILYHAFVCLAVNNEFLPMAGHSMGILKDLDPGEKLQLYGLSVLFYQADYPALRLWIKNNEQIVL